ncbi:MAG TPA: hypothetical protein VKR61_25355 [Bryobacteraceae bacterium]|nr:hypothetical protein [Bryobacteraceae bacterium]
MILRNVQRHPDIRVKLGDSLELKAGKLQHIPLVRPGTLDHGSHRSPDIAAHLGRDAARAQNMAHQRGSGGLAICAGDPHGAAAQEWRGQFHLPDHARPPFARLHQSRQIRRHPRGNHDQITILKDRVRLQLKRHVAG